MINVDNAYVSWTELNSIENNQWKNDVFLLPEFCVLVRNEWAGDWSGVLFLSTKPNVVTVFCRVVDNKESPLRRSVVVVWSETDS